MKPGVVACPACPAKLRVGDVAGGWPEAALAGRTVQIEKMKWDVDFENSRDEIVIEN